MSTALFTHTKYSVYADLGARGGVITADLWLAASQVIVMGAALPYVAYIGAMIAEAITTIFIQAGFEEA